MTAVRELPFDVRTRRMRIRRPAVKMLKRQEITDGLKMQNILRKNENLDGLLDGWPGFSRKASSSPLIDASSDTLST